MRKHLKSVFENEQDLLASIFEIHNKGQMVDCDPMYFKGNFYKDGIGQPRLCFDLNPQEKWITQADATNLPLDDNSLSSIVLDPPFLIGNRPSQKRYYSATTHTMFKDFSELEKCYKGIIKEANRVLKDRGLLIFKCQDYTDSKTTLTHCFVHNWAIETGFKIEDLFIMVFKGGRIWNSSLIQRHARKYHSYWIILKK